MVSLHALAVGFLALALVRLGVATIYAAARRPTRRALLAAAGSAVCLAGLSLAISLLFSPDRAP